MNKGNLAYAHSHTHHVAKPAASHPLWFHGPNRRLMGGPLWSHRGWALVPQYTALHNTALCMRDRQLPYVQILSPQHTWKQFHMEALNSGKEMKTPIFYYFFIFAIHYKIKLLVFQNCLALRPVPTGRSGKYSIFLWRQPELWDLAILYARSHSLTWLLVPVIPTSHPHP